MRIFRNAYIIPLKAIRKILIVAIYAYQKLPISRMCCIYYPTCSQYALDAIKKYTLSKAILKTTLRILCCNPVTGIIKKFTKNYYDPA